MIRQGEIWASFLTKCSMLNYIYYTVLPFLPMQPPSAVVVTPPIRQQPPPLQKLLCEKVHPLCQHSYHHNNHYYHCYHTGIRFGYMYLSCSLWWLDASGDHTWPVCSYESQVPQLQCIFFHSALYCQSLASHDLMLAAVSCGHHIQWPNHVLPIVTLTIDGRVVLTIYAVIVHHCGNYIVKATIHLLSHDLFAAVSCASAQWHELELRDAKVGKHRWGSFSS